MKNTSLRALRAHLASLAAGLLLVPAALHAVVDCSNIRTPAVGVDARLWGNLQPTDVGQVPAARDSTNFFGQTRPDSKYPLFTWLDVENHYIFTTYMSGFQIWDASTTPGDPQLLATRDGWKSPSDYPSWGIDGENRELVWGIDAPAGHDDIVAVAGIPPAGFTIWNTSNKTAPVALYQDVGKNTSAVYADTINGRQYAFVAANSAYPVRGGIGVAIYDMTAARQFTRCVDPNNATSCAGVWVGRVGAARAVSYLTGLVTSSGKHLIAFSSGTAFKGLEIWDVSNVNSPVKLSSVDRLLPTNYIYGLALFEQNGNIYLGSHQPAQAKIYNVTSCVTTGACSSIDLVWSQALRSVSAAAFQVTASRSGSTPFLYFAPENFCSGGRQKEYLFNVSNPAAPVDITPQGTITVNGDLVDYWGWYDVGSPTGFSMVLPRAGIFDGNYFYRAAWSIFDVHQWTAAQPAPPVANFTWSPSEIYAGDSVTFTDTSTGVVESRQWTFQDGAPSSSAASPQAVTFATSGPKQVSLQANNQFGTDTATLNVPVLDPSPAVASASTAPASPKVCQPVTLTANGVTGKATINFTWVIRNVDNTQVGGGSGNPFQWDTSGINQGSYTATATASNGFGSASASTPVVLAGLQPLPGGGSFAPTSDTFAAGSVPLHVNVGGATDWSWNYGDGRCPTGTPAADGFCPFTNDPTNGPNPVHDYTAVGQYSVKVRVRNCVEGGVTGVESSALTVNVTQIQPVEVVQFQAQGCAFGFCTFNVNQAITFTEVYEGSPTLYEYDWKGDGFGGTDDETLTSPPATHTHTYTTAGNYTPVVRVRRGTETPVTYTHLSILVGNDTGGGGGGNGGGGNTPSISVGGPTTGSINQSYSFAANAANCAPAASGWSWSLSGGTATGNTTGNQVTVSWTTAGSKSVSATNTACGSAHGNATIAISDGSTGGGGGGGLTAAFTISPAAPKAGDTVTFDATSSAGSPNSWLWNFGDGSTGSGQTVTHVFGGAQSVSVRLEIGKPGSGTGCSFGVCTAVVTKPLTVAAGGPPPPPPLAADIATTANCTIGFGVSHCDADAGTTLHFTASAPGATSFNWSFGDGGTATGAEVDHTFLIGGDFEVTVTASDGTRTATASRAFSVTETRKLENAALLPWVDQATTTRQNGDLYAYNPGPAASHVTITFRREGDPDPAAPSTQRTIDPNATLEMRSVVGQLHANNSTGYLVLQAATGDPLPLGLSLQSSLTAGKTFGELVPSVPVGTTAIPVLHLIGLSDTAQRSSEVGVNNPNFIPAQVHVTVIGHDGSTLGSTRPGSPLSIASFGSLALDVDALRALGANGQSDYRVELETVSGGQVIAFATLRRAPSADAAYEAASTPGASAKQMLMGLAHGVGAKGSLWRSDLVLMNPTDSAMTVNLAFQAFGLSTRRHKGAASTSLAPVTLDAGETVRISNVLAPVLGSKSASGVLILTSNGAGGVYPSALAESYDANGKNGVYGQLVTPQRNEALAAVGAKRVLVGLRDDGAYRSQIWFYNGDVVPAEAMLTLRGLDGRQLAVVKVTVGVGKPMLVTVRGALARKFSGSYTVEAQVTKGKLLIAGQVVNKVTGDQSLVGATAPN